MRLPPIGGVKFVIGMTEFLVHFIDPPIGELAHESDRDTQNRILEGSLKGIGMLHQAANIFTDDVHSIEVSFHRQRQ